MIRIAGLNGNDFVNGEGVSVSLFLQGCPFHCKGCHNPETWNPKGGNAWDEDKLITHIIELIAANGIQRNLSILGGEPLNTDDKREFVKQLIYKTRDKYPDIKIVVWTGYTYEDLIKESNTDYILKNIDYLIEGPFVLKERDITLKWRGSRNQNIYNMKTKKIENE
jgi:anaerobic ribonucleoside-triphosphate reductase activating protein